jgi:hypothetical protein
MVVMTKLAPSSAARASMVEVMRSDPFFDFTMS